MKKTVLAAMIAAGTLAAGTAQADSPIIGQIQAFGFNYCPQGWMLANGAMLPISQNQALYSLIGTRYGGNGTTTFALPNLTGGTIGPQAQPITWCMATQGLYAPNPGLRKSAKPK
jgi:microcystin-dependent protein